MLGGILIDRRSGLCGDVGGKPMDIPMYNGTVSAHCEELAGVSPATDPS